MKRSKILALLLMLLVSIAVNAQNVTASGIVKDALGEPVVGASVVQNGNSGVGTITDIEGHFQLQVPKNSQLKSLTSVSFHKLLLLAIILLLP